MAHYPTITTNTTPTSDECQSIPGDVDSYYETMETLYSYPNDSQHSELNTLITEEQTHWPTICSSPKDRPKSPYNNSPSPYHNFPPVYYQQNGHVYDEAYYGQLTNDYANNINRRVPVKRRNSANKKERKRTQSINSAFSSLREKIPCVPCDTKVSKIKTLRLAISYISFLQNKLNGHEDPSTEFKPELVSSSRKINAEKRNYAKACGKIIITTNDSSLDARRNKGRTGWPQHVWAGTLNNNNKLI